MYYPKKPHIVLVTGKARHGKDTICNMIDFYLSQEASIPTYRTAFADKVKEIAREKYDWDGCKNDTGRNLLQLVGDGYRHLYGEDFWIKQVNNKINPDVEKVVIISDTRYMNEAHWFNNHGYNQTVIKVTRLDEDGEEYTEGMTEEQREHPSESEIDDIIPNIEVINDGSIEDLQKSANRIGEYILGELYE